MFSRLIRCWAVIAIATTTLCGAGIANSQGFETGGAIVSDDAASKIPAFSYREGPKSDLLFRGTALAPEASGEAEVEFQDGRASVELKLHKLPEPWKLGPYTTYVLWALTMEGRANNLGALEVSGGKARLRTAAALAKFALVVSAEPHFGVTVLSRAVVLVNYPKDVKGSQDTVRTLLERADYRSLAPQTIVARGKVPMDLYQARYAFAIANTVEAAKYAPQFFSKADALYRKAEAALISKKSTERRSVAQVSRDAIQSLEESRREALVARAAAEEKARQDALAAKAAAEAEQRLAAERAAAEQREAAALAASAERDAAARAELERVAAAAAAEKVRTEAEAARLAAEAQDREAAAVAAAAQQLAAAKTEADRLAAVAAEEARQREVSASAEAAAKAKMEAIAAARADLTARLNRVLPTTDTPRGLVAQIAGVQFATGAARLSVAARESLARFSGIVIAYPDMRFVVEGHTDNIGSEAANIALSLRRGITVRDYLIAQGVPASTIDVKGVGPASPVSDNTKPAGRALNRRVEIVMSGGPIAR